MRWLCCRVGATVSSNVYLNNFRYDETYAFMLNKLYKTKGWTPEQGVLPEEHDLHSKGGKYRNRAAGAYVKNNWVRANNSLSRHCSGPASQEYQCVIPSEDDDADESVEDSIELCECLIPSGDGDTNETVKDNMELCEPSISFKEDDNEEIRMEDK